MMTREEIKRKINDKYGFTVRKIALYECGNEPWDSVTFNVCGHVYTCRLDIDFLKMHD